MGSSQLLETSSFYKSQTTYTLRKMVSYKKAQNKSGLAIKENMWSGHMRLTTLVHVYYSAVVGG